MWGRNSSPLSTRESVVTALGVRVRPRRRLSAAPTRARRRRPRPPPRLKHCWVFDRHDRFTGLRAKCQTLAAAREGSVVRTVPARDSQWEPIKEWLSVGLIDLNLDANRFRDRAPFSRWKSGEAGEPFAYELTLDRPSFGPANRWRQGKSCKVLGELLVIAAHVPMSTGSSGTTSGLVAHC